MPVDLVPPLSDIIDILSGPNKVDITVNDTDLSQVIVDESDQVAPIEVGAILPDIIDISPTPNDITITTINNVEVSQVVVTEGKQGFPGPPGPQGPTGGATLFLVGPSILSGHSAVACDSLGRLIYADCTIQEHLGAVLGIIDRSYSPGENAEVQTAFTIQHNGWTWNQNQPIFIGANGQLTQTLPSNAKFMQVIGRALSSSLILIDLQMPISLT